MTTKYVESIMTKQLILGIDTGGTHTDAVVFDPLSRNILASTKTATNHHDLSSSISRIFADISHLNWAGGLTAISRIHLSTTLATNAITEGQSNRVGLVLIGYDQEHSSVKELAAKLPAVQLLFVEGGHNFYGQEVASLDEEALLDGVVGLDKGISGWAISSMFSVKNPAHEMQAAELIKSVSTKPITMGRDLTGQLDAVRRAATAALNAGLVIIINRLLDAVKVSAAEFGLTSAKLMVVKGDGSLVSEDWARAKPIETVVSGPAASLVGAKVLADGFLSAEENNLWVVDVGGTTTDMALVKDGLPAINPNGAHVGNWDTMTVAVEARTIGLGGDSWTTIGNDGLIGLGPRRVMPLCRLARQAPQIVNALQVQNYERVAASKAGCFFFPGLPPEVGLSPEEQLLIDSMGQESPLPLASYLTAASKAGLNFLGVESLHYPSVMVSAFTPTDAMSILGLYKEGVREAAVLGAEIIGRRLRLTAIEVAKMVLDECGRQMAQEIISYGFECDGLHFAAEEFLEKGAFGGTMGRRPLGNMDISVRSVNTIILIGAPVNVFMPFLGKYLAGRILVPPCFDAASATGAAASPVYLTRQVEIHTMPAFAGYRLFLPDEIIDGESVDELATVATGRMTEYMHNLALLAGAEGQRKVSITRTDRELPLGDSSLCLGSTLTFTVKEGRPGA